MGGDVTWETKGGARWGLGSDGRGSECCSVVGTYCLHAHDGLLHLGDIRDVVLIGLELLLLYPFVDAYHQFPGDVGTIIHTYQHGVGRGGQGGGGRREAGVRGLETEKGSPHQTEAPRGWP